jgi:hypothetical protein
MTMRNGWLIGGSIVGLAAIAGALAIATSDPGATQTDDTEPAATSTVAVERRDLIERDEVDGTLGYGETRQVASPREGTVTGLPAAGTVLERGANLFEVDGRGVPLLYGTKPMWRGLGRGVDDGVDIQQLEENLVALGFAPEGMTVDAHWDGDTTRAVRDWQDSLGIDDTGLVAPSDLVFLPGAVRVASSLADTGAAASGPLIEVTGTQQLVAVRLDASQRDLVAVGDAVQVELPDDTVVPATVSSLGSVATADDPTSGDTTARIDMEVTLDPTAGAAGLDAAPVDVQLTRDAATGVLAVPVRALLALAEGGYALEVVDGATTRLVSVETGAFADGYVEVTGDIADGDDVVVPE